MTDRHRPDVVVPADTAADTMRVLRLAGFLPPDPQG
jgi:hypothetical protein